MIASLFFSVYSMAVDTLFLCFCKYAIGLHIIWFIDPYSFIA